jgi:hypothetical protein
MSLSSWRLTWREDFDRVVLSMSTRERAVLHHSRLSSISGRRVFVSASDRLQFDVVQSTYLMEQAVRAFS